jgi:hypothetical protein
MNIISSVLSKRINRVIMEVMMKRLFPFFFWALFISIVFFGCTHSVDDPDTPSADDPDIPITYPRPCWGEWVRIDKEETWYITSGDIQINGNLSTRKVTLDKVSDQVIEVQEGTQTYYLYASRQANMSFTGTVILDEVPPLQAQSRAIGGIGIQVTISSKRNPRDTQTVEAQEDGTFRGLDTIPGDEYELTFSREDDAEEQLSGVPITVTPQVPEENLGTFHIGEGVNFKAFLKPKPEVDMTKLYATTTYYDFILEIVNIGTETCTGANYTLDFGTLLSSSATSGTLGTMAAGSHQQFNINVACNGVQGASEFKEIQVTIRDPGTNKTWQDAISLKFNKSPLYFSIKSDPAIQGVLIAPDAKSYFFKTQGNSGNYTASVRVPWSEKDYLMVFSGVNTDTAYTVGINTTPSSPSPQESYEPNNTEQTATVIATEEITQIGSSLRQGDIDYYKIRTGSVMPEFKMDYSLSISRLPDKTSYFRGQNLNITGLVVSKVYTDLSSEPITVTNEHISGYDKTKLGEQVLTITVDGKTVTFKVTVIEGSSSENAILSFIIEGIGGTIDEVEKIIEVRVPGGTSLVSLTPAIEVSEGATIEPGSGVAQNFTTSVTTPIIYTVKAADGTEVEYKVRVMVDTGSGESIIIITSKDVDQITLTSTYAASLSKQKDTSFNVHVDGGDSVQWYVDGGETTEGVSQDTFSCTFSGSNYSIGVHYVMVLVTRNGAYYSKELRFRVTK